MVEQWWWNSVVEQCGGTVWWNTGTVIVEQCGGTVWLNSGTVMVEQ